MQEEMNFEQKNYQRVNHPQKHSKIQRIYNPMVVEISKAQKVMNPTEIFSCSSITSLRQKCVSHQW